MTDAWYVPTGHNDPSSVWNNETAAYDNSTSTRADTSVGAGSWSGFLELTHTELVCTKLRLRLHKVYPYVNTVDVDIYDGGAWVDVYQGGFSHDVWEEHAFAQQSVTRMRIRLHSDYGVTKPGYIAEGHFYGSPPSAEANPYSFVM
ncbi:MAG: hypothetical protein H8E35_03725 [Ardenticatenia bacterium]|nr:hypothetical protein [Ardenticatenia bacterium]